MSWSPCIPKPPGDDRSGGSCLSQDEGALPSTSLESRGGDGMARILAVDDDRIVLKLIQHRLERSGHEVIVVPSPKEALEWVLAGNLPDVFVLDVSMPEISGIELLHTMRMGFGLQSVPAIFLSSRISPEDIDAGRALGATYLTKPFVASALLKAIGEALKQPQTP